MENTISRVLGIILVSLCISLICRHIASAQPVNTPAAAPAPNPMAHLADMTKTPTVPSSSTYKGNQLVTVQGYEREINNHCAPDRLESECHTPGEDFGTCVQEHKVKCAQWITIYTNLMEGK